jgi:hypothetical protein
MKIEKSEEPGLKESIKQNWVNKLIEKRLRIKRVKQDDGLCTELFFRPKLRQN